MDRRKARRAFIVAWVPKFPHFSLTEVELKEWKSLFQCCTYTHTHTHSWAGSAQASLHPTGITAHRRWARLLPQVTQKQHSPLCVEPRLSQVTQPMSIRIHLPYTQALQVTNWLYVLQPQAWIQVSGSTRRSMQLQSHWHTCRSNSRSKGTAELTEFKLDRFWHSEETGM